MTAVIIYPDSAANGNLFGPDWLNVANAADNDTNTFTPSAVGSAPPDVFTSQTILRSKDGASYSSTYSGSKPAVPTTKQFVVFDNWTTDPTIAIAKTIGLQLHIRMENDDGDNTDVLAIQFSKELFADLTDDAVFTSVEVEYLSTSSQRIYRARMTWEDVEPEEDNSFGAAVVPFIPQLLLQLQNKAKKKK